MYICVLIFDLFYFITFLGVSLAISVLTSAFFLSEIPTWVFIRYPRVPRLDLACILGGVSHNRHAVFFFSGERV